MAHEFKEDTIDDIRERDIFNLETFLKKRGRIKKTFDSHGMSQSFMGDRLNAIMEKLGISIARAAVDPEYEIDKEMERKGIQVQNRIYEEPEDEWRSGIYVYQGKEIAGFVGYPIFDPAKFMGYNILCTQTL